MIVASGPATTLVRSITVTPSRGSIFLSILFVAYIVGYGHRTQYSKLGRYRRMSARMLILDLLDTGAPPAFTVAELVRAGAAFRDRGAGASGRR